MTPAQREALELAAKGRLTEQTTPIRVLDKVWDEGWITWRNPRGHFIHRAYLTPEGEAALAGPTYHHQHRPVFLTPARDAHCYTTDTRHGLVDAGEVLEPKIVSRFTQKVKEAEQAERDRKALARAQARELMAMEDRIVAARRQAETERNVVVRREMQALERTLQRNDTPAAKEATVRRLRAVERVLDTKKAA